MRFDIRCKPLFTNSASHQDSEHLVAASLTLVRHSTNRDIEARIAQVANATINVR